MAKRKRTSRFTVDEAVEFLNHLYVDKPLLPVLIPLIFIFWAVERWIFSLSNWVLLVVSVWATIQYCSYQRQRVVEDLNSKWKRVVVSTLPTTPLEHCEWLNKLFMEVWLNYVNPKLSIRFSSIVEKRLKQRKSKLIERIELEEFSLGSAPPYLGRQGTRWSTSGDQRFMHIGFDWETTDLRIMLLAKLAKPMGTARIVINSLIIKGDLLLLPVLDGRAILYSFVSTPEVRIGIAFGSGGSQSLPATELPGVSSWLVKILTETIIKTMVEPRRRCFSLPAVELRKKAVGGIIHVTVVSASKLTRNGFKGSPSRRQQSRDNDSSEENLNDKELQTFVEVELEQLTRKTTTRQGASPSWNSTFNMALHEDTGTLRFNLYNCTPGSVKFDYIASCEIKVKYVADDSTMFWAIGPNLGVIADRAEICGKEVEMVVPFEGINSGELTVKLLLKEWQFSDGSHSFNKFPISSLQSINGSLVSLSRTGRKINVIVVEGKDLSLKERSGKCNPYVKLQYGKVFQRTRTAHSCNPQWNQKFEIDEIGGGEYLMIKCFTEDTFGDDSIGSARVNMEGLVDGLIRDVWVPLENVTSGELRLQLEAVRADDCDGSKGSTAGSNNGWIELVIIEGKDLIAADLRGTSDPYVRVQYGNLKKRTKIMYKTLNPRWNQTLEFPDDGSPLILHVKDHNALLPTSSIGDCIVEYQRLPPNQTSEKWIPLQGVKRGEIHIQITRRVPEVHKRPSFDSEPSLTKSHQFSGQMRGIISKFQSLVEDGDIDALSAAVSEMESLEDMQEDYMLQLETEQALLLDKIKELGEEIFSSSTSFSRRASAPI